PSRRSEQPRVHSLVGVGVLARVEPLPDGRFNIVLKGVLRARIREELQTGEPYRVVRAEPLLDDPAEDQHPAVRRGCEELRGLLLALCAARPDAEAALLAQRAARAVRAGELADLAASMLLESPGDRQAALEALAVQRRLQLVAQAAATQLARAAR